MAPEATTLVGYAAGALTTLSFLPQLLTTIKCKSAKEVSYGWLFLFALGVTFWLIYGAQLRAWPIIMANAVTLALVLAIVVLKAYFD